MNLLYRIQQKQEESVLNTLFAYNWQVRDEWFEWCRQVSHNELIIRRTGGAGSILYTLFHITEVEYSWIRGIQEKQDLTFDFADYHSLQKVRSLSDKLRSETTEFLNQPVLFNDKLIKVDWEEGSYTREDILHHIIVHEIHHIGQLSIWARELQLQPVSADFIGKDL